MQLYSSNLKICQKKTETDASTERSPFLPKYTFHNVAATFRWPTHTSHILSFPIVRVSIWNKMLAGKKYKTRASLTSDLKFNVTQVHAMVSQIAYNSSYEGGKGTYKDKTTTFEWFSRISQTFGYFLTAPRFQWYYLPRKKALSLRKFCKIHLLECLVSLFTPQLIQLQQKY